MNIFSELKDFIINSVSKNIRIDRTIFELINVEIPKNPNHGDLSTNIAMILAPHLKENPRELATTIIKYLQHHEFITKLEIAGPGFINIFFDSTYWHKLLKSIIMHGSSYGITNVGNNEKVLIEYVSANPTGPLHIGHARGAIYGDVLASLMEKVGYNITKEYYVNDAGKQIEALARSLYGRYLELFGNFYDSENYSYPGDYLIKIAKMIKEQYGDIFLSQQESEYLPIFTQYAVEKILDSIKDDLKYLSINHNSFISEKELQDQGKIAEALEKLAAKGMTYKGELEKPKGIDSQNWQSRTQLLLKSTNYADDQDRALTKEDGSWTYLAGDAGYCLSKMEREFSKQILIVGADHSGYEKRMLALTDSLSNGKTEFIFKACQLVNFIKDNKPFKMSKRQGTFVTVRDVAEIVGKDVLRFIMLTRRNDVPLDFDLDKFTEQSKDNPVFYVQYAHARINSIFNMAKEINPLGWKIFIDQEYDLSLLINEIHLVKKMAIWPKVIHTAVSNYEPHRITFYLEELSGEFHALWNKGREDNNFKFIIREDNNLTAARLALIKALQIVIASGLTILGVTPVQQM